MDATSIFSDLLKKIEDSNLNYVMNKTPFSASISIKCSFIKRFGSVESDVKKSEVLKEEDIAKDTEAKNALLEDENLKQKKQLKCYEQVLKEQNEVIEQLKKDLEITGRFENLFLSTSDQMILISLYEFFLKAKKNKEREWK